MNKVTFLPIITVFFLIGDIALGLRNVNDWSFDQQLDSSNQLNNNNYYNKYQDDWTRWMPPNQGQDAVWRGKMFPYDPNVGDQNPTVELKDLHDPTHGIIMGTSDARCDDAKMNLTIDWNMSPENYTCFDDRSLYMPKNIHPLHTVEHIPKAYSAQHKCMNESITYNEIIPTFGTHRPLWAVYGEYTFLPKQRWIHNLEHGAVVMLYHPCANKNQVNLLRQIVKNCLYRHIITPYNLLSPQRPLAIVTWGHRLEMSKVAPAIVIDFIQKHALQGPEKTSRDGQYFFLLKKKAVILTDVADSTICEEYSKAIHMK